MHNTGLPTLAMSIYLGYSRSFLSRSWYFLIYPRPLINPSLFRYAVLLLTKILSFPTTLLTPKQKKLGCVSGHYSNVIFHATNLYSIRVAKMKPRRLCELL